MFCLWTPLSDQCLINNCFLDETITIDLLCQLEVITRVIIKLEIIHHVEVFVMLYLETLYAIFLGIKETELSSSTLFSAVMSL